MSAKTSFLATSLLLGGTIASNAAIFLISNVQDFSTDTLYATNGNIPMSSGSVSIGYFGSTVVEADIDTIPELFSLLGQFTTQSSSVPGSLMGTYGIGVDGYADNSDTAASSGLITLTSNPGLLGRDVYSIVTDAGSLASATASSSFALVKIGTIGNDEGGELSYTSNPAGLTPIIGSNDTLTVDLGIDFDGPGGADPLPASTYNTLKLAAVPEPSALLLSAFGVLGLLRRKR